MGGMQQGSYSERQHRIFPAVVPRGACGRDFLSFVIRHCKRDAFYSTEQFHGTARIAARRAYDGAVS